MNPAVPVIRKRMEFYIGRDELILGLGPN